ncbi:MAG: transglutaminase family protein [Thermoplasmata archaeon]|nr:MAG: transglutaminase family protein [Thermoplasmata archaeon]
MEQYLRATDFFDWNMPEVESKANELTEGLDSPEKKAKALFYFIRDKIKYRIVLEDLNENIFKASTTLARGYGFCIPKANLLVALARASSIPSRLHFADIRNHQLPSHILERLGTNLMTYHGYVEFFLNDKWIKVNPAFDIEMCKKFDIIPVEFSGKNDALFHHLDQKGRLHIDYLKDHGTFEDFPYERVIKAFTSEYKR